MNKKELRNIIRERKRQFSGQQLEELSLLVLDRLRRNIRLQQARSILLYYSLPDEVNTHQFIDELVNQGKQVFLPVVVDGENMEIREYTGSKDLRQGSFHIMEPVGRLLPENEYGAVTGRERRCGWIDLVALRYAIFNFDISFNANISFVFLYFTFQTFPKPPLPIM